MTLLATPAKLPRRRSVRRVARSDSLPDDEQRFVLYDVSWSKYEQFLKLFDDRHCRLTYSEGTLEIMTLSPEHERWKHLLGLLVNAMALETEILIGGLGSTTFRRRDRVRGLEPDQCFYTRNFLRIRGKPQINLREDPPPDLAIEVDVTSSSLDRMGIYAALRVPEIWRFDGQSLQVLCLDETGNYRQELSSPTFPRVPIAELVQFLHVGQTQGDSVMGREFRMWLQKLLASPSQEKPSRRGPRKS